MSSDFERINQHNTMQQLVPPENRFRHVSSMCSSPQNGFEQGYQEPETTSMRYSTGERDISSMLTRVDTGIETSGLSFRKPFSRRKVGSLNVPEPEEILDDSSLMFYSDDALRDVCNRGVRRGPFGQLGKVLGCFMRRGRSNSEKKAWAESRAMALLELSKRQQSALEVKQDTIDMLEWKLEQLQVQVEAPRDVPMPQAKVTFQGDQTIRSHGGSISQRYPTEQSFRINRGSVSQRIYLPKPLLDSPDEDTPEKLPHVGERNNNPQPEEPYLDFMNLKLQDTEQSAIMHLFDMMVVKARLAIRYFCKNFMKQMEVSGYSVWRTLAEIEPTTRFQKKEHTAFVLESRLNMALFKAFETDSFDDTGITRIIDPTKRCSIRFQEFQRMKAVEPGNAVNPQHSQFEPEFLHFCEYKMREMWFLFPWNIIFKDGEERATFTSSFIDAAKCVWLLHKLAFSVQPTVSILRVGRGMDATSMYVEQVTAIDDGCKKCGGPKVEFMSMPGFQFPNKIIKCQVYRHLRCK